jgi:t-SNARE complex subunit (syntaxin)
MVAKRLAKRSAQQVDARRALVVLTDAGCTSYDEVFPQVAAMNARVMEEIDDRTAQALSRALELLTAQAVKLNSEVAQDVHADRRAGGSRRVRRWPETQG